MRFPDDVPVLASRESWYCGSPSASSTGTWCSGVRSLATGLPPVRMEDLANDFTQSGIRRQASLRRDGSREDLLVFDLLVSDDQ
jgi:hypothetical protein